MMTLITKAFKDHLYMGLLSIVKLDPISDKMYVTRNIRFFSLA